MKNLLVVVLILCSDQIQAMEGSSSAQKRRREYSPEEKKNVFKFFAELGASTVAEEDQVMLARIETFRAYLRTRGDDLSAEEMEALLDPVSKAIFRSNKEALPELLRSEEDTFGETHFLDAAQYEQLRAKSFLKLFFWALEIASEDADLAGSVLISDVFGQVLRTTGGESEVTAKKRNARLTRVVEYFSQKKNPFVLRSIEYLLAQLLRAFYAPRQSLSLFYSYDSRQPALLRLYPHIFHFFESDQEKLWLVESYLRAIDHMEAYFKKRGHTVPLSVIVPEKLAFEELCVRLELANLKPIAQIIKDAWWARSTSFWDTTFAEPLAIMERAPNFVGTSRRITTVGLRNIFFPLPLRFENSKLLGNQLQWDMALLSFAQTPRLQGLATEQAIDIFRITGANISRRWGEDLGHRSTMEIAIQTASENPSFVSVLVGLLPMMRERLRFSREQWRDLFVNFLRHSPGAGAEHLRVFEQLLFECQDVRILGDVLSSEAFAGEFAINPAYLISIGKVFVKKEFKRMPDEVGIPLLRVVDRLASQNPHSVLTRAHDFMVLVSYLIIGGSLRTEDNLDLSGHRYDSIVHLTAITSMYPAYVKLYEAGVSCIEPLEARGILIRAEDGAIHTGEDGEKTLHPLLLRRLTLSSRRS